MKKKIMYVFLSLALLTACTHSNIHEKNSKNREVGEHKTEITYEDHYVVTLNYPKMDIEALDEEIEKRISQYENTFLAKVVHYKEQDKAELNIAYESYLKDDRYISIKFDIYECLYQQKEYIETLCYDTKKGKFIELYDIYDKEALEVLSAKTRAYFQRYFPEETNTNQFHIASSPILSNYDSFVLKKEALVFYFEEKTLFDKEATLEIAYDDIQAYTALEKEEEKTFVPYDQVLNEPVKNIDPNKPMIALTYDDGPTPKYTAAILDALKEHNASATFFILGSRAATAPELLQRMILEGNEIGNHTFSHKQLTTLSKENIEEEIEHTQESIYEITKKYPDTIRPPYGSKNEQVMQAAKGKKLVAWTIDTEDWRTKNVESIVKKVLNEVEDGSIILMHDLYASTAEASIILIPELIERGYQLVTVSELYEHGKNTAGKIITSDS
ncbi:MAG: polysaccharide deacetylase family protein [Erysipelotrichaceae bacterium]|nr:polysaccharide deacetylase family protein [Erysipelotrichaceae bacterium]